MNYFQLLVWMESKLSVQQPNPVKEGTQKEKIDEFNFANNVIENRNMLNCELVICSDKDQIAGIVCKNSLVTFKKILPNELKHTF